MVYRVVHSRLNDCAVPRSCGYKTSPKSSPLHQHAWLLVWGVFLIMFFRFSPNVTLCIMAKHLHFGLVCSKGIVLEVFWFVQMQLCKPKLSCHVLFRKKRLSSDNPFKRGHTCLVWSQTLSFNMLTEACSVWGVVLGLPAISQSIVWSDHGVNFLGRPLLGGLVSVFLVFYLWIIFFSVNDGLQIVWKWPYYSSQIDGSNNCFSKIITDVFPLLLC